MRPIYLIVGLGSIGRRHLECLRSIRPDAEIVIWRQYSRDSEIPYGADTVVFDLASAIEKKPEAAIISNPATMHVEVAMLLAEQGIHLLIEKPLSHSLEGIDQLLAVCKTNGVLLMVAYILRHHEGLKCFKDAVQDQLIGRVLSIRSEVGQYLPDWRPGADYRNTVSARKELGGGALLELSHELDYLRWIFGDVISVRALIENSGVLDIDTNDLVELLLEISDAQGSKCIASVHLDMLQRPTIRYCKAVGERGTLVWDAIANSVRHFDADQKVWHTLLESQDSSKNSIYITQLEAFLSAVESDEPPVVTGEDGRAVIEIIEAARASARENRVVKIS